MARYAAVGYSLLTHLLIAGTRLLAQPVELVDVDAVRAEGDPRSFIHALTPPASAPETTCDILVAGAGAGGFAAALRAADR